MKQDVTYFRLSNPLQYIVILAWIMFFGGLILLYVYIIPSINVLNKSLEDVPHKYCYNETYLKPLVGNFTYNESISLNQYNPDILCMPKLEPNGRITQWLSSGVKVIGYGYNIDNMNCGYKINEEVCEWR